MFKYYGYFSSNKMDFTSKSIDSLGYLDRFALKNMNHYHNFSYKENIGLRWKLHAGLSYSNNKDDIRANMKDENKNDVVLGGLEFKKFNVDNNGDYFNAKLVIDRRLKGLSAIRFGSEYNFSDERTTFTSYNGQQFMDTVKQHITSLFGEADVYITSRLAFKLGTRFEHSSIIDQTNIAPRASIAYKLGKGTQASLAYGIFYQNPERRYLPSSYPLDFMKATHYIAQFQRVESQQSFRAEIFYKKYKGLVKTDFINGRETAINNAGFGD